jgi:hypothetical protein
MVKKEKYRAYCKEKKLRLQVFVSILFFVAFKATFTDWEHFKVGLTGDF